MRSTPVKVTAALPTVTTREAAARRAKSRPISVPTCL